MTDSGKPSMAEDPWDAAWSADSRQSSASADTSGLAEFCDRDKIRYLEASLPESGVAVEVGCGTARLLVRIGHARSLGLVGVDRSAAALAAAARSGKAAGVGLQLVDANALHLPFRTGSVDVVLSGGLLEHFPDPVPVLSEMVRILKPGGLFYADVVPRKFSLYRIREMPRMARSGWFLPGVVETTFGGEHYRRQLLGLGCTDVVYEYRGVYPPVGTRHIAERTRFLDGTAVARMLGWYFMIRGRKA